MDAKFQPRDVFELYTRGRYATRITAARSKNGPLAVSLRLARPGQWPDRAHLAQLHHCAGTMSASRYGKVDENESYYGSTQFHHREHQHSVPQRSSASSRDGRVALERPVMFSQHHGPGSGSGRVALDEQSYYQHHDEDNEREIQEDRRRQDGGRIEQGAHMYDPAILEDGELYRGHEPGRYYHHEPEYRGRPYSSHRYTGQEPPVYTYHQPGGYGFEGRRLLPQRSVLLQTVTRPGSAAAGPRALSWTDVDTVNSGSNPSTVSYRSSTAAYNGTTLGPESSFHYRSYPESSDRPPPRGRDYLREPPPHLQYYEAAQIHSHAVLQPPRVLPSGANGGLSSRSQRPMSAGGFFGSSTNKVHPSGGGKDRPNDLPREKLVSHDNYGEVCTSPAARSLPSSAAMSRDPSEPDHSLPTTCAPSQPYVEDTGAPFAQRAQSWNSSAAPTPSRPSSALSRGSGRGQVADDCHGHDGKRLYHPGKAHLSRPMSGALSGEEGCSEGSPRAEYSKGEPRSAGVLSVGLPAKDQMGKSDNPSLGSQNLESEAEDAVGPLRTNNQNLIGDVSTRHRASFRRQVSSPADKKVVRSFANVVRAVNRFRDAQRRANGELVFSVDAEEAEDVNEEFDSQEIRGCNAGEPYDWRRKRSEVDKVRRAYGRWVFLSSLLGLCAALLQNEMIYSNVHPTDFRIEVLKGINFVFTFLAALFLVKYYWLCELFDRIYSHLHKLQRLKVGVPWYHVFCSQGLWIEIVVLLPHCPPFFTMSFGVENMKNFSVYRVETIMAVYNVLRTYTFWRWYRDIRCSKLPKRHTISNFTGVPFNSVYILKKSLDGWSGVLMIVYLWSFSILSLGYVFRAAEHTACVLDFIDHPDCKERGLLFTSDNGLTFEERAEDYFPMNGFWMV